MVGTEVGPGSDEIVETEVEFCPPRATNRMPEERPIITGAVGAEADERDLGQTTRFGPSRTTQDSTGNRGIAGIVGNRPVLI